MLQHRQPSLLALMAERGREKENRREGGGRGGRQDRKESSQVSAPGQQVKALSFVSGFKSSKSLPVSTTFQREKHLTQLGCYVAARLPTLPSGGEEGGRERMKTTHREGEKGRRREGRKGVKCEGWDELSAE